jgi:hypothetical protein
MRRLRLALVIVLAWITPVYAFDMCFDFRKTAGFVTDPSCGVPVLLDTYPTTYTNANGDSLNAGWLTTIPGHPEDSAAGNDPRIAGDYFHAAAESANQQTFQGDLSSGSAPGSGAYTIDLAAGGAAFGYTSTFTLQDSATVLITGTGTTLAAGHFEDATGADVAATVNWTGTTVNKTFATTTMKLIMGAINFSAIAHLRLTKAGGGPPPQRSLTGVGL